MAVPTTTRGIFALLLLELLAIPAFAWRESPVRYDTVVVYSAPDRLRLEPDMGSPDPDQSWEDYWALYPRQAITRNAYCYSSTTRHERCFSRLRFADSTMARLDKNAFFSRDSLARSKPLGSEEFGNAFNPPLRALLEARDYKVVEIELNRFDRLDRSETAGWAVIFSWLPAFAAASLIEVGISQERREPFRWGRAGLMTAGLMGLTGAYAAIAVDPSPNWKTIRIVFRDPPSPR